MWLALIFIWLYQAYAIVEEPSSVPANKNFLRRITPTVTVLGDYLYIEGGRISLFLAGQEKPQDFRTVNETLSLSLATSWVNSSASLRDVWKFTADGGGGGNWTVVPATNPGVFAGINRGRGASWATCNSLRVALDLSERGRSNQLPLPRLLSYELDTGTWHNDSANGFNGLGTSIKGSAVCIPSSGTQNKGTVLFLGGQTSDRVVSRPRSDILNRMDNLTFYDMATQSWHWQLASGEIPPGRTESCSVVVQGPRNTSEIYLYGGGDPTTNTTYSDIHVLTIPGFAWFKLEPTKKFPRWAHSCAVGGRSRMIVVGGQKVWSNGIDSTRDPDVWSQGIGVFDLRTLEWSDGYEPDSQEYQTPQMIEDWYRAGGLERVNWSDHNTKALFIE
ncbi:hypothetical protein F4808DRAFT_476419 [Astrocystis sublimbata]|nr:hypothetical protein F4808DRAFT_476419 [Astrocystis sublimbata]